MVVVLRRPGSPYESARFPLRGLDARASYRVANPDTQEERLHTGEQLLEQGLEVTLKTRPGSACLIYERVK